MFFINIPAGIIIFLVCMKKCKTKEIEFIHMTLEDFDKMYKTKKKIQKGGGILLDTSTQHLMFPIFLFLILKVLKFRFMNTMFIKYDNQSALYIIILYENILSSTFALITYILTKNTSLVKMMLVDSIISSICYAYTKDVRCTLLPFFLLETI